MTPTSRKWITDGEKEQQEEGEERERGEERTDRTSHSDVIVTRVELT